MPWNAIPGIRRRLHHKIQQNNDRQASQITEFGLAPKCILARLPHALRKDKKVGRFRRLHWIWMRIPIVPLQDFCLIQLIILLGLPAQYLDISNMFSQPSFKFYNPSSM